MYNVIIFLLFLTQTEEVPRWHSSRFLIEGSRVYRKTTDKIRAEPGSNPDSGFFLPKIRKNLQLKKIKFFFLSKTTIYLSLVFVVTFRSMN